MTKSPSPVRPNNQGDFLRRKICNIYFRFFISSALERRSLRLAAAAPAPRPRTLVHPVGGSRRTTPQRAAPVRSTPTGFVPSAPASWRRCRGAGPTAGPAFAPTGRRCSGPLAIRAAARAGHRGRRPPGRIRLCCQRPWSTRTRVVGARPLPAMDLWAGLRASRPIALKPADFLGWWLRRLDSNQRPTD